MIIADFFLSRDNVVEALNFVLKRIIGRCFDEYKARHFRMSTISRQEIIDLKHPLVYYATGSEHILSKSRISTILLSLKLQKDVLTEFLQKITNSKHSPTITFRIKRKKIIHPFPVATQARSQY